jgi:hypothetical protein
MNGALFEGRKIRILRSVEKLASKSSPSVVEGARSMPALAKKSDGKVKKVKKPRHVPRPPRDAQGNIIGLPEVPTSVLFAAAAAAQKVKAKKEVKEVNESKGTW